MGVSTLTLIFIENKRAKIFVNEYTNSKYRGYKQPKFLSMRVSILTVEFLLKRKEPKVLSISEFDLSRPTVFTFTRIWIVTLLLKFHGNFSA